MDRQTCDSQADQNSSSLPRNETHEQSESPRSQLSSNASNQDAVSQTRRIKGRRTRTGCLTCRFRKIKCDETLGSCANCARVMLQCRWPSMRDVLKAATLANRGEQQASSSMALPRRIRSPACESCRAAKYKCSRDRPSCSRCSERHLICTYDDLDNMSINTTPSPTAPSLTNDRSMSGTAPNLTPENSSEQTMGQSKTASMFSGINGLSQNQLEIHLDAFFTHVYPCQANAFIHRGTLLRNIQSGQIAKKLILAICAVASRFIPSEKQSVSSPKDSPQAQSWAQEAKKMLILEEDMSTDTVGTALLLAKHDINCGKFESAWMLSSIANRVVLALGLNKAGSAADGKLTWIEQETRRRLVWACYCLDRMMSTGEPDFVLLRTEHMKIQLPCEEHQYMLGIPCVTPVPNLEAEPPGSDPSKPQQAGSERDIGMSGHYVQIMGMRYMVLKYTRNRNDEAGQLPPWDPMSTFSQCDRKMTAWRQSLPPQFQLLPDTIYAREAQNQLTPLIMLHIWYDQCMSDLYRITLPGFPDSRPSIFINAPIGWVEHHQAACVRHARNIGATLDFVTKHVDTKSTFTFLDGSLPMCVFQSMRLQVQWFFMLSSKEQAESMVELLNEFDKLMKYIERMKNYFSQAQWLLKEMRKMLLWHGFPINGGSEFNNKASDSGGSRTSHPWLQKIYRLNQESRGDEGIQGSTAANHKNTSFNFEDSPMDPFHGLPQRAENLPSDMVFGNEPDVFQQEGMNTLLSGHDQGQIMPDTNNFISLFGEWAAKGVEGRTGGTDVWSGL